MGIKDILKSIFPNLESLIKFDFNKFINLTINITKNSNNQINNSNNPISINEQTKQIDIDINKLSSIEKQQLKKAFADKKICFLEKKTNDSINTIKKTLELSENEELLNFYKNILPPDDLQILRASFFIKKAFKNRNDISIFKNDINKKYGQRGVNITNLYSAGYYDKWIKDIYSNMKNMPNYSLDKFKAIYDKLVLNVFFILFVSKKMDEKNILEEVDYKLKYGTNFIHIHGIGRKNIETIKNCLTTIQNKYNVVNINTSEENNIIFVEIYFKK